ncbi:MULTISPECIES: OmpP1/FadL family transporter [unclassified Rhizobium]|uniref:OmpP1/FadL family transporter n=1 Tax=unclassified Rhizobium TaxID=2613769 RepID=UPI001ADC6E1E|nr:MULTISPECIES: OmpP1/FadL family transporter [unclassified Rhizobium]MBO9098719.1 transporter [Rhizobium sp. L58/93]MBO9132476.1 transporter [Rhizobium sp. B209b/85]MBO9168985.1 transporter [Rhizobium sp. L245/93]MBO9184935.1 transporter [Rhizobium sp. E27B/91]QXZ85098.1 transporter [Rhizobium sp. K1/93]
MRHRAVAKAALVLLAGCSFVSSAAAGGIERAGYDIDLLFDKSRYAFEGGVTFVMPERKLTIARDINPRDGNLNNRPQSVSDGPNFGVPSVGIKIGITDDVDCLGDYSEPFGAHSNPGTNWAGANYNSDEKIYSHNYGLTCSYKFDAGPGQLRLIGGGFYQEVGGFKEELVVPLPASLSSLYSGMGRLDISDSGWGWRSGVAYEIPEYAMRASLVYNSQVKYDNLSGTVDLTSVPKIAVPGNPAVGTVTPVYGSATAPDSLELKLQTGIAPDWLAFGSAKWTNWSTLQSIAFCPKSTRGLVACRPGSAVELTSLDLLYKDGWTLSGGIGHKFNAQWSGAVSLTWDQGTSQGYGLSSDTWMLGAGLSFSPTEHVEYRLAGAVGLLTSGKSGTVTSGGVTYGDDVTYRYGNDFVGALSTSVKVKF